jgi:hypothetical protein
MIVGGVLAPLFISPLFGDYWKFGFASPVCLALLLFGPKYGRLFCAAALFVMAIANIALGYRSLGVLCGLLILLMAVNWLPLKLKS